MNLKIDINMSQDRKIEEILAAKDASYTKPKLLSLVEMVADTANNMGTAAATELIDHLKARMSSLTKSPHNLDIKAINAYLLEKMPEQMNKIVTLDSPIQNISIEDYLSRSLKDMKTDLQNGATADDIANESSNLANFIKQKKPNLTASIKQGIEEVIDHAISQKKDGIYVAALLANYVKNFQSSSPQKDLAKDIKGFSKKAGMNLSDYTINKYLDKQSGTEKKPSFRSKVTNKLKDKFHDLTANKKTKEFKKSWVELIKKQKAASPAKDAPAKK
jgi:hypothetical protein